MAGRERALTQHGGAAARGVGRARLQVLGLQCLGDAEVQQLDLAVGVDQHVAGLEVAVHQQVAVGMGHRVGQLQKQRQAVFQRTPAHRRVDGLAVHVLHHEVGCAVAVRTCIEQPRDVGVVQPRQGLAFRGKARQHLGRRQSRPQQLGRGASLKAAIGAFNQPHFAHAAFAQWRGQAPRAQALARPAALGRLRPGQRSAGQKGAVCSFLGIVLLQQGLGLARQLGRCSGQTSGAFTGGQRVELVKQGLDGGPVLWGEGCHARRRCRCAFEGRSAWITVARVWRV